MFQYRQGHLKGVSSQYELIVYTDDSHIKEFPGALRIRILDERGAPDNWYQACEELHAHCIANDIQSIALLKPRSYNHTLERMIASIFHSRDVDVFVWEAW